MRFNCISFATPPDVLKAVSIIKIYKLFVPTWTFNTYWLKQPHNIKLISLCYPIINNNNTSTNISIPIGSGILFDEPSPLYPNIGVFVKPPHRRFGAGTSIIQSIILNSNSSPTNPIKKFKAFSGIPGSYQFYKKLLIPCSSPAPLTNTSHHY